LPTHFHSELAEALCTRDEEAADRAMRAHIRFGLENVINGMTPELAAAAAVR
jgi:DNA-binding FadR family transcriptional regulator